MAGAAAYSARRSSRRPGSALRRAGRQHGRADCDRHYAGIGNVAVRDRDPTPEHAYCERRPHADRLLLAGRITTTTWRPYRAFAGNLAALKGEPRRKPSMTMKSAAFRSLRSGRGYRAAQAGRTLAVDGSVISGRSEVDQSLITGGDLADHGGRRSAVYAGTLVRSGALRVRVSAASEGTLLSEIFALLDNAVQSRSRYLRLAERASRLYAGRASGCGPHHDRLADRGRNLARFDRDAIAVLIITCPCALGLAFPPCSGWPPAVCSARRAAQFGRRDRAHGRDRSHHFDKTGTLTLPSSMSPWCPRFRSTSSNCRRLALSSRHPRPPRSRVQPAPRRRSRHRGGAGAGLARHDRRRRSKLAGRPCGSADEAADEILQRDPEASVVALPARGGEPCLRRPAAPASRRGQSVR